MKFMESVLLVVSVVGISVVLGYPAEPPITFSAVSTTTQSPRKGPIDPNHVPESVCNNMLPIHGDFAPSNDPPPYEIKVSTNKVAPGEKVTVTVIGKENADFKGLYIQGRINDIPEGQFEDPNHPKIRVNNCPPGEKNAASYISSAVPTKEVKLDWTAPNAPGKEVVFRATLVKNFSVFWVGVVSEPVKIQG
ncbi:putative defense protein [Anabrus simplex]|uniref:putative defense protein n=1 Tax=Anabrus simplex TaxID=316456 RepID=UPI0035A37280